MQCTSELLLNKQPQLFLSFRVEGLVDCNDIDSFNSKLETLQRNWPENLVEWLYSKNLRSLKETFEKCIKCVM